MTECKRCGRCCRVIAIKILDPASRSPVVDDPHFSDWVTARGLVYTSDGWLIIPSRCPRLIDVRQPNGELISECTVQHNKPVYCKKYPEGDTWTPYQCAFRS